MKDDKHWRPYEPCIENQFKALFYKYKWMKYILYPYVIKAPK